MATVSALSASQKLTDEELYCLYAAAMRFSECKELPNKWTFRDYLIFMADEDERTECDRVCQATSHW